MGVYKFSNPIIALLTNIHLYLTTRVEQHVKRFALNDECEHRL